MKAEELHKLSEEEIRVELDRLRRHVFDLRAQAVTEKLENPSQVSNARRDIARLLTEQRSRDQAGRPEADA